MLSLVFPNKADASNFYINTFPNSSDSKNKALLPSYLKSTHFTKCKI